MRMHRNLDKNLGMHINTDTDTDMGKNKNIIERPIVDDCLLCIGIKFRYPG